jgi:hypothetical protein
MTDFLCDTSASVYVAGHRGMVGAAIVRAPEAAGFEGELDFDTSKPGGAPRKLADTIRINALRWKVKKPLHEGLEEAYAWFVEHRGEARA